MILFKTEITKNFLKPSLASYIDVTNGMHFSSNVTPLPKNK